MICISAKTVLRNDKPFLRIDALVQEEELYTETASSLEGVRSILRSGMLPTKRFHMPLEPFLVSVVGDPQVMVVESAEAWEGDFPGKRLTLFSRDIPDNPERLIGKSLDIRPVQV